MKILAILLLTCGALLSQGVPFLASGMAHAQGAAGSSISSTPQGSCSAKLTNTCTFDNATSGSNILIVVFSSSDGSVSGYVSSVTDSGSGSYVQVGGARVVSDVAGYSADMWYSNGAATGITSITATLAVGTSAIVAAMWFNGANASPLDDADSWTGNTPVQVTSTVANTISLIAGTYGAGGEDLCDSYAVTANAPSRQQNGNLSPQFFVLTAAGNHTPANCGFQNFFTAYRIAVFK